jgi:uncharacterized protein YbcI
MFQNQKKKLVARMIQNVNKIEKFILNKKEHYENVFYKRYVRSTMIKSLKFVVK